MERKLSDLEPSFYRDHGSSDPGPHGVTFDCPVCVGANAHSICVPWAGKSPFRSGVLWKLVDGNLETLTVSPSIDCTPSGSCTFHGFVQGGMVRW